MFSRQRKGSPLAAIVSYTLPKLHTGKNWYVDFTCYDPAEQKMKRKKYMLDGIVKVTDRRKMAADIIATVSQRLALDGTHGRKFPIRGNMPKWMKSSSYIPST